MAHTIATALKRISGLNVDTISRGCTSSLAPRNGLELHLSSGGGSASDTAATLSSPAGVPCVPAEAPPLLASLLKSSASLAVKDGTSKLDMRLRWRAEEGMLFKVGDDMKEGTRNLSAGDRGVLCIP